MNLLGITWILIIIPALVNGENFYDYFNALKVLFGIELPVSKIVNARLTIGINKVNLRFLLTCNNDMNCTEISGQFLATIVEDDKNEHEETTHMIAQEGSGINYSKPPGHDRTMDSNNHGYPGTHSAHNIAGHYDIPLATEGPHEQHSMSDLKSNHLNDNSLTEEEVGTLLDVITDEDILEILKKKHEVASHEKQNEVHNNYPSSYAQQFANEYAKHQDQNKHLFGNHLNRKFAHTPETEHVDVHLNNPDIIDVFKNYELVQQPAHEN